MSSSDRFDAAGFRHWLPPDMDVADEPAYEDEEPLPPLPTADEIEAIRKQAWDEGHAEGRQAGFEYASNEAREQARRELETRTHRFDVLLGALAAPFEQLDDEVERELLALVVATVRQLLRREVQTDPGQIIGVVREALGILPVSARDIRVVLHPEDAELVREAYALGDAEVNWAIVEDPVIARGGCKVFTETSRVDASLESRLANVIAPLLAGMRHDDEADGPPVAETGMEAADDA